MQEIFYICLRWGGGFDRINMIIVGWDFMKARYLAVLFTVLPIVAHGATSADEARVGVRRMSMAAAHSPNVTANLKSGGGVAAPTMNTGVQPTVSAVPSAPAVSDTVATDTVAAPASNGDCRDAYRKCMDDFCLLDESEGYRCACSSNINKSKSLIQEIQKIQEEADLLYTEGVEREQLGAKARLVFGESEAAKKSSRASGLSFSEWLKGDDADDEGLGADADIGDGLYAMASEFCADQLKACGAKAEMEEMLYSRQVVQDCKSFESYLADQKANATQNKRTAEAAVRSARLAELGNTNKYNRGECLLAYRACVADKGGCGTNFENCLDADLLGRRANACENVLDQCMAVKNYVLQDWEAESQSILVEAAKYSDRNQRLTCLARIQNCLEDGCSTSTNSACLTDVNVAAGICPVIDECNTMIPGIKSVVNDKLGYLRVQFCQNDVDKCLQDKCGQDFTAPECVGKKTSEIVAMCPQSMFPSCKNETQFDIIVSSILLQMDYQMMQGCLNHFSEQLGKVCGTDMSCLPQNSRVATMTSIPETDADVMALRDEIADAARQAVDNFFVDFEKEKTVAACLSAEQPGKSGRKNLGDSIFYVAKEIANRSAESRALREFDSKVSEISRTMDVEAARKNCETTYKPETPDKSSKNYSYIRSVSFEPDLRNCHVCRMQQVCETGGESKGASIAKSAAGMSAAGASAGTMVTPGWGTAIGGAVGLIGGAVIGAMSGGQQDFCQEIESCEDINM
ncbi:hypothetical protein HDR61_04255 [bacterium]|nr:hypothetical protein [bacterium]